MEKDANTEKLLQESVYEKQKQIISQLKTSEKKTVEEISEGTEENLPAKEKEYSRKAVLIARIKGKRKEFLIGLLYALFVLLIFSNLRAYLAAMYYSNLDYAMLNPVLIIAELIAPLSTWIISTKYTFYNYRKQKFAGLYIVLFNILVFCLLFFEVISLKLFVPLIFKIPVGVSITPEMVVTLARLVTVIFSLGLTLLFAKVIFSNILSEPMQARVMHFKVDRNRDKRKNKEFSYDMKIVRRMENGSIYTIKEKDRSLHSMIDGSTGTGKTSSCLTVAINDDFDQKLYNENWQKKELHQLLRHGKVRMICDFEDMDFSANYFRPADENDKDSIQKLKKIQTVAKSAGVTAMAPNAAFADEIFNLAKSKGLKVRRVDPETENGRHKEGFIGFNPYYISPRLTGQEREMELFSRSTLVADVLQAIFDQSGNADPYFASLNQNITTTISSVLLLTYASLHKRQPTLKPFQGIVNDFSKIKPYRDELIRLYAKKSNPDGSPVMEAGKADVGEYQFLLDTVDNELLGSGAVKMIDQARGLRIIINQILVNPLVKDVLCSEESIDMDEMLADGQITVVNYALKLGSAGTAFGLFFMLSFIKAVIRRPGTENTRLPHFFYADEFSTLLHPQEEMIFTYFRQFRTAAMVALQTLDQMDKVQSTAFLRGVVVGNCAHQIVFGRAAISEIEMYQKFAGTKIEKQEMNGYMETALSSDAPTYSMNYRETMQETNVFSTNDIRMRDFQEVTVFSVDSGTPVEPFHGRVDFLPKYKTMRKRRKKYDWHSYFYLEEQCEEVGEGSDILATSIPVAHTNVNMDIEEEKLPKAYLRAEEEYVITAIPEDSKKEEKTSAEKPENPAEDDDGITF